ncbi:hypothetical protein MRX96_028941 [Rhipicephalus microplus]
MAASTPAALDAGRDDIDGMDFREADANDLATLRDSNTPDAGNPRQRELDGDWQIRVCDNIPDKVAVNFPVTVPVKIPLKIAVEVPVQFPLEVPE